MPKIQLAQKCPFCGLYLLYSEHIIVLNDRLASTIKNMHEYNGWMCHYTCVENAYKIGKFDSDNDVSSENGDAVEESQNKYITGSCSSDTKKLK